MSHPLLLLLLVLVFFLVVATYTSTINYVSFAIDFILGIPPRNKSLIRTVLESWGIDFPQPWKISPINPIHSNFTGWFTDIPVVFCGLYQFPTNHHQTDSAKMARLCISGPKPWIWLQYIHASDFILVVCLKEKNGVCPRNVPHQILFGFLWQTHVAMDHPHVGSVHQLLLNGHSWHSCFDITRGHYPISAIAHIL